ncbi:MAG: DNA-binding response regulator [Flavobacteriales bacterium]|nr:DNA-binding response regulator [Flavobacteriales bacterium]|tara:strand:+ start:40968 stop:41666 length:699 start_codon:yes stop_codon:yes gene_type:complete
MENTKVLLVDDEQDIIEFVKYNLEREGYWIETANNGKEALEVAVKFQPALILLDVMMPEMDGIEVCHRLRENKEIDNTIIAMLTARNEDYTQVAGLQAGADDFIKKPIKPRLLVTKVESLLRRRGAQNNHSENDNKSAIVIDRERFLVLKKGEKISLPKKEFELLLLLSSVPERVFTRDEIYGKIWGSQLIVGDRTIDVHIRKLREKLGDECIQTVKGVGYKFNPEEDSKTD